MYKATLISSFKEVTKREAYRLTEGSDNINLYKITELEPITIRIVNYAQVHIINDKSDDKEYDTYLYIADDGTIYSSGSENLYETIVDIFENFCDDGEVPEDLYIKVYQRASKNRSGNFVTATLA